MIDKINRLYNIKKIESIRPTSAHLCLALLVDLGCKVGSMPDDGVELPRVKTRGFSRT